jgi:hypothetical protein
MEHIGLIQLEGPLVFGMPRLAPLTPFPAFLRFGLGRFDDIGRRRLRAIVRRLLGPCQGVLQGGNLHLHLLHLLL